MCLEMVASWHRFVILWYRVGLFVVDAALRWLCSLACRITSHGMPESRRSPVDLQMVHLCGCCRAPGAMLVPARDRAFYPVCSFLVDSCQMATNLPRPARSEVLLWTTSLTAVSIQIREGVPTLSEVGQVELWAARCMLRGTARDAQAALVLSPARAQHSEAYATL